jgi:hypothetical protein
LAIADSFDLFEEGTNLERLATLRRIRRDAASRGERFLVRDAMTELGAQHLQPGRLEHLPRRFSDRGSTLFSRDENARLQLVFRSRFDLVFS